MQMAAVARRGSTFLKLISVAHPASQFRNFRSIPSRNFISSGKYGSIGGIRFPICDSRCPKSFCSVAVAAEEDVVKELHGKVIDSIKVKKSAPPNAWLWSIIEKCKSRDDIELLFDALKQLRIFRLSNLRINDNFNSNLCQEVTKACIRAGALNFGIKAIWKHNVYGLTPTVGSANQLLSYAEEQKDVTFMVDIMSRLKKNALPLQPATADIVFSICYDADNWELLSKYAKRFATAGVKLRKTTYEIWLGFASRRGDLDSLWRIEKLRSELYNKHTIKSGFSHCKGLLLEHKPEDAATLIQELSQNFPESKRPDITAELQKLVSEWPAEVIKHQKLEDRKALIDSLKSNIPAMIKSLSSLGIDSSVNLEDLNIEEGL